MLNWFPIASPMHKLLTKLPACTETYHILALAVLFYKSSSHIILSRLQSGNFNLTPGHQSALFITLFQNWPFFSNLHLITDKPNSDTESISFSAQPEPQEALMIPTF
jgi:hypothetical protein